MGQFIYSPINPIRFIQQQTIDARYNSVPFDSFELSTCYFQKYQTNDVVSLQVLSDYAPTLKLYKAETNALIATITPTTPANSIQNQTLTLYEFQIVWLTYGTGNYYFQFTYNANDPALYTLNLTEQTTPNLIDINGQLFDNGTPVITQGPSGAQTAKIVAGDAYQFTASCPSTGSYTTNDKIRLTVIKNLNGVKTTIYDNQVTAVASAAISQSGIAQPGASYTANMSSYDSTTSITPINIADNTPVTPNIQTWQSETIQVQPLFANTRLFQYTNSKNDFSVIFKTGIIFNLRVEAGREEFTPTFDDIIYNDQDLNPTKVKATPKREWTLYIPARNWAQGIPPWMADRINWMFACDTIQMDGVYYQNVSGSKWEVARTDPDGTGMLGTKIQITEVMSPYLQQFNANLVPVTTSYREVNLTQPYKNQAADFPISNLFTKNSVLENIQINIYSGSGRLNIGLTSGGSEIGFVNFSASNPTQLYSVDYPFSGPTTVYISGITSAGATLDLYFNYLQNDAPFVVPATQQVPVNIPTNTIGFWEAINPGDFTRDWNATTGLGNPGTNYAGCAICDGRNSTINRGGTVIMAAVLNTSDPNWLSGYDVLNTVGGIAFNRLIAAQNAPHNHAINSTNSAPTINDNADVVRGTIQGTASTRGGLGDGIHDNKTIGISGGNGDGSGKGAPIDNRQPYIVTLQYKKIA